MGALFDRVLAHIDAHLFEPLSVAALADVAGLSPYHFSRAFTARFGTSVMSFVRDTRMAHAAVRLHGTNPPALADLAFDCGFESQEAFTRAFRRRFGTSPGKFKREASNREMEMAESDAKLDMKMMDGLTRREAFTVAGVVAQFDDETKSAIPALWPKLIAHLPLSGQKGSHTYGVCWATGEGQNCINYMAGVEIAPGTKLLPGLETIEIAAQSYLVFRVAIDGPKLHQQLQAAMREIWGSILPNSKWKLAKAPDFEFYPENFNPMEKGMWIDYYVAVVV